MKYAIFSCSPRANANSDFCASLIQKQLQDCSIYYPSRKLIQPCVACGFCENALGQCAFSIMEDDTATRIYKELFQFQEAIFIVPIYFYHVPGTFKSFLDRAQTWYAIAPENKPAQHLNVRLIFLAGRQKGEKLFEGAELSIKYALKTIGANFRSSLYLRGIDGSGDLSRDIDAQHKIIEFIQC